MSDKTEKTSSVGGMEREYVIPLRRNWNKVPRYKRANKAIGTIKEFLVRHMKIRDGDLNKVKIDRYLNEFVWFRGIRKPPARIKVKARKEGDIVKVELFELPKELGFKKTKLEKRDKKASEVVSKKKAEEEKAPEKAEETAEEKEQQKKEADEETRLSEAESKKASVVEAGKEMEKVAAKTMKHQTKISKQPKRQRRMALQK